VKYKIGLVMKNNLLSIRLLGSYKMNCKQL